MLLRFHYGGVYISVDVLPYVKLRSFSVKKKKLLNNFNISEVIRG